MDRCNFLSKSNHLKKLLGNYIHRSQTIRFGSLRRLEPISTAFGYDRGTPIGRYYIEKFLAEHSDDIRGNVLEIADDYYSRKFGGKQIDHIDILHADYSNEEATIIGNLATGEGIPKDVFDCMILTQTLLCIYDVSSAIKNSYFALKPGGVLLATVPGICQISRYDMDRWGDYWRFTTLSTKRLFEAYFPSKNIEVRSYGNVLVAISSLHGLATEELLREELEYNDPNYEVLITIRAIKPKSG